jgi:hypothetical protein
MRVLTFESVDKQQQTIEEVPYKDVLAGLHEDHSWVEVIDAYNQHNCVRAFFDIDSALTKDPLPNILTELNSIFSCGDEDWAISDGSRDGKISYHVLSKVYFITLKNLRSITFALHDKFPAIDKTVLCISSMTNHELLFLRLPNQSKSVMNKSGIPMKIMQGELEDFIVTYVDKLKEFTPPRIRF